MVKAIELIDDIFKEIGTLRALFFGTAIGAAFGTVAAVTGSFAYFRFGFFLVFPLFLWVAVECAALTFSGALREKLIGYRYANLLGSVWQRAFSPIGLMALSWFWAQVLIFEVLS